jgi:hypothetical protein
MLTLEAGRPLLSIGANRDLGRLVEPTIRLV